MELAGVKTKFATESEKDSLDKIDVLAHQLKQICDKDGKEINVCQSALLLHQIGKEYHSHKPAKLSLIRGAALYNAAICRNPNNVNEIQNDLSSLCKLVLRKANAKVLDANLIEKSMEIKQTISEWRKDVKQNLLSLQNISDTAQNISWDREFEKVHTFRHMQEAITEKYVQIMADTAA